MRPPRFAVSGYYGCGNAGDEAVLAGLISALQEVSPGSCVNVLSQNPVGTEALHGVKSAHRMNWTSVRQALLTCDALISGGGSLLQDTTSLKSLLYYLLVIRAAQFHRKPVMMCAQGIGPLNLPISQRLTAATARKCKAVTVRDAASAALLQRIGVTTPNVEVTADLAFALSPAPLQAMRVVEAIEPLTGVNGSVVIALRHWGSSESTSKYTTLTRLLLNELPGNLILLPMQHPADLQLAQEIYMATGRHARCHVLAQPYAPSLLISILQRARLVVAMRLHALILGITAGLPPVALSYDPKIDALMETIQFKEGLFSWENLDAEGVTGYVTTLLANLEVANNAISAQKTRLRAMALRNAEVAMEMVNDKA